MEALVCLAYPFVYYLEIPDLFFWVFIIVVKFGHDVLEHGLNIGLLYLELSSEGRLGGFG